MYQVHHQHQDVLGLRDVHQHQVDQLHLDYPEVQKRDKVSRMGIMRIETEQQSSIISLTLNFAAINRTSCLLYFYTHSDCRMTRTSCLLYFYTHSDCRMTRTFCLLYFYTQSDCRMTRTSCLLYMYTQSDCRMTRTSCLLYFFYPL